MRTIHICAVVMLGNLLLPTCGAQQMGTSETVEPQTSDTVEDEATHQLPGSTQETEEPSELPEVSRVPPTKEMESEMSEIIIETGVYFGECVGICAEILTINSEKMHFENFAVPIDYSRPENVDERSTEPPEWDRILAHYDTAALRGLPDQIGDPDASDLGGEYVQITNDDFSKRVDFEFGSSVPEIDGLLEVLRQLRLEFSNKYR